MTIDKESYLQCPYCAKHESGHEIRVPKTVGKYRVKKIYGNTLIFQCAKCSRIFKVLINTAVQWDRLTGREKENFRTLTKEDRLQNGKKLRIDW